MSTKARRMLVLLLIILKETGPTAACSSSCSSDCDCSRRGLTSVPQDLPTNITTLDLQGNAITNLSQSDFSRYRNLRTLYLIYNQISTIHNKVFHNLISLTVLYLNENQLTTLPADIFEGLGNLRDLSLSQNQITNLPADIFVGLVNLQTLSLYQNQITDLPADIFEGLGRLWFLALSQNQLTNLSADIFVGLGKLWSLYLSQNQFHVTSLSADIFVGLDKLLTLSLDGNQLTRLPADIFLGLGNLQELYLNDNQLTSLSADIFAGLGNLQTLDLGFNDILSIEPGTFNDTTQLHRLNLQNNSISSIAADTFGNLLQLEQLLLNSNNINPFPLEALSNLNSSVLSEVRLDSNQLETLPLMAYDLLASIPSVYVFNNPWQCDCRMAPFKQRMTESYSFEDQIRCAGPGSLAGQYLRDVNPENLICEETTTVYSTLSTKRFVDSTLSLSTVSSSSPFYQSAKSTSKASTLSLTASNTPTDDSIVNPAWSTVSTDGPSGFQSTMTERNAGPIGGGIFLPVPLLATLCIVLVLLAICAIAFAVRYMYERRKRDHTSDSSADSSNSDPAGTSSGHDDHIKQHAEINSQSKMSHPGTDDNQHIYNVPTDNVHTTEYNTIAEINQSECPKKGAGNMQSLDSFGYLVLPPSLPPENQTGPQAGACSDSAAVAGGAVGGDTRTDEAEYGYAISPVEAAKGGPKSHKYMNTHEIAAAKDAAENDDEPVDNQSQTAAAPGADSPNHYEPLRNPSSQQQHTYTSLMPHD
ncbi:leucine-rich repeat-containing protein 15-like [Branchiostoma lanceolatum]|uniref:leucine-rich repeat-containing protein 15-like n=1 Tax=Branchiostoma lanceolatum TaxID=7740 RepID=UPI003455A8A8